MSEKENAVGFYQPRGRLGTRHFIKEAVFPSSARKSSSSSSAKLSESTEESRRVLGDLNCGNALFQRTVQKGLANAAPEKLHPYLKSKPPLPKPNLVKKKLQRYPSIEIMPQSDENEADDYEDIWPMSERFTSSDFSRMLALVPPIFSPTPKEEEHAVFDFHPVTPFYEDVELSFDGHFSVEEDLELDPVPLPTFDLDEP